MYMCEHVHNNNLPAVVFSTAITKSLILPKITTA